MNNRTACIDSESDADERETNWCIKTGKTQTENVNRHTHSHSYTHVHVHTNKRSLYSKKIFSNTTINFIKFKGISFWFKFKE